MRRAACILAFLALALAQPLLAGEVVEKYDSGKLKLKYATDAEGRKNGDYHEYYESGKLKVAAAYKADKLHGLYTSYYESGIVRLKILYTDGQKNGGYVEQDEKGRLLKEQVFWNDLLLYPKSARLIKYHLEVIAKSGGAAAANDKAAPAADKTAPPSALAERQNVEALRRLNSYRYLADVPWDVALKAEYGDYAQAAAEICSRIGRLDHHPPNPGMPQEDYKKALYGTTHANLYEGRSTRTAVDGFMNDSNEENLPFVGHRRWCLNPAMAQAGFGESGRFAAMFAHDQSRRDVPDYDFVAWPARGYVPAGYFGARQAWSVSLNPAKFLPPTKADVKANVYPLAPGAPGAPADPRSRGQPLELNFFNVDATPYGIANCIIFRPAGAAASAGQRYWVEITGLRKADRSPATVEYLVEFISQ